jgi:hypothetical protein
MTRLFSAIVVLVAFALSSPGVGKASLYGAAPDGAAPPRQDQKPGKPEKKEELHFSAVASNVSELARAGIVPLDIYITRFTDDGEEEKLMSALEQKGQDGLLEAFRRVAPVGRMRVPGQLATEFHYARASMGKDGRRRIILATDRPIGFVEATNRTYTMEYPFTMLELRIDDSGMGDGQLFLAAKFMRSGNLLLLENLSSQAVVISRVRQQKR